MEIDTSTPYRVAIYAAPQVDTDWWIRGSQWLGRCAHQRNALPQPPIEGIANAQQLALTADPRRYGWHATLKAPMRLSTQASLEMLRNHVAQICRDHRKMELPDLMPVQMGSFLAFRPALQTSALGALADDCVRRLQPLAAPLSESELQHRRRQPLTPEEDALMLAWGYPWVFHKFRFHFSLTGSVTGQSDESIRALLNAAQTHFSGLGPLQLDGLSIFIEPTPGADFVLFEQIAFAR
jgi:Protein of unknown function (DUF1045)